MFKYPKSEVKPVTDKIHGQYLTDNYRWLENGETKQVQQWVKLQNEFTDSVIGADGHTKKFENELAQDFNDAMFGNPTPIKGRYFWGERKAGEEQFAYYVKESLNGEPRKLIDPNGLKKDNTVSIDYCVPSRTGKFIAYGLSEGGNEKSSIFVKDVETGKDLKDNIPHIRFASISWLPDDSGFYYTRLPAPGEAPKGEENYHLKIYFHILGEDYSKDVLIFGKNRPKEDMLGISTSIDGRYLSIYAAQSWNKNDLFIYDNVTKKLTDLVVGIDAKFHLGFTKDKLILLTNYKAENFRLLTAHIENIPKSIDDWQVLVAENENVLDDFRLTKSKLLINYMVDACTRVDIYDYNGNKEGELPLPAFSDLDGIGSNREEEEFFYSSITFTTPKTTFRYDPKKKSYSLYRKAESLVDPAEYIVKQEWLKSKDGTKLPMFIIHQKDVKLDSNNPTLLVGYGCHGISQSPMYLRSWFPWLRRKGIYAVANIRGGGEYGEKWHRDGSLDKKQNTFDDFIAASEHLIKQKYTNKNKLAILGGSNGGLMVGACLTQRPDLFKAVVCRVPVLDVVRYHKFLIAGLWVHEFGNPDIKKEFNWIIKWSPYHNVKEGVEYPSVLFTTANKDSRVDPLHARKMTALLQATNKSNAILLRTEMEAGHGPGKPVHKMVEGQAVVLSYLAWQVGLKF